MKKLYFDMDGTCADFFEKSDCLERMYEKDFFSNLKPLPLATVIDMLAIAYPEQVFVLSATLNEEDDMEKDGWINQYIPSVRKENRVFTRVGEDKSKYVEVNKDVVLIDDYSKNLTMWVNANGSVIKALNGINNKSNQWANTIDVNDCNDCLSKLLTYLR